MITKADFIIRSPKNGTQVIVEAKSKTPASTDWAIRMRRNLIAHGALPPVKFFLLALPERFYLWKDSPPEQAAPTFEIDAKGLLQAQAEKLHIPLSDLRGQSFELLVQSWLEDVANSSEPAVVDSGNWMVKSGFLNVLHHGIVEAQSSR